MSTGNLPSMLGMTVRSSPAPVMARIWACSSITDSTSTGERESSSIPGVARTAAPGRVCVQAATSITEHPATRADHARARDRLAEPGMIEGIPRPSNTVAT